MLLTSGIYTYIVYMLLLSLAIKIKSKRNLFVRNKILSPLYFSVSVKHTSTSY